MNLTSLKESMEQGVYDFTVNGECSNCGSCCSNLLPISQKEADRIARYIKKHKVKEQRRLFPTAGDGNALSCPFRSEAEKKCLIYSVRPAICQDFRCDKPKKGIKAKRELYQGRYGLVDMRATFFGGEPVLDKIFSGE